MRRPICSRARTPSSAPCSSASTTTSGVSIDTELSNLITLQNAYGANARVMSTIQQMMATLLQMVQ